MKIVVMVGSLRKDSLHAVVARNLQSLAPEGVTVELLPSVGDLPLYNFDIQSGGFPAGAVAMGAAIKAADAVAIVTPEYNYSVPGVLKNALDWLSRLPEQPFVGKPVSLISGSPGPVGAVRMQYHLRQIMVFLDALVLNKPEVAIGMIGTKVDAASGKITDQATSDFLKTHLAALVAFAKKVSA